MKETSMQLTLRSQMIAGVAALSAAAVAVTPITQSAQLPSPARVSSAVQLATLVSPFTVIGGVLDNAAFDLFFAYPVPPGGPTEDYPDPADWLYWPDGFYGTDFANLYAPGYWGAIPDAVNQFSFGGLSAVVNNWSSYAWAGFAAPAGLVEGLGTAVFNTPQAVIAAIGYLAAGDSAAAIATLQTLILEPIQTGIAQVVNGVGYIVDNVIGNVQSLLGTSLPLLVSNLGSAVVGGAAAVVNSLVTAATQVVTDIVSLQFEDAWNDALYGFLGPDGTLGVIETLAFGVGLIEDVSYDDGEGGTIVVPTVVTPSIRSVLTSTGQRLGNYRSQGEGGIGNDAFTSYIPSSAAAASARRAPAAAAVAPVNREQDVAATAAAPAKHAGRADAAKAPSGKAAKAAGRATAAAR